MKSLKIDDGYKEFMINDDPGRVIRFNPSDVAILTRIRDSVERIEQSLKDSENDFALNPDGTPAEQMEQAGEAVRNVTELVKEQINYIFNADVSEAVFGNQSPLSLVGGVPLYERFLNVVIPEIEKAVKAEQKLSEKRVSKYVEMVK